MKQQHTQVLTKEELARLRKEEAFNRTCRENAAVACNILREQLRNREMDDLIRRVHCNDTLSNLLHKEDFVFVSRQELKQELEKRISSLQTTTHG